MGLLFIVLKNNQSCWEQLNLCPDKQKTFVFGNLINFGGGGEETTDFCESLYHGNTMRTSSIFKKNI